MENFLQRYNIVHIEEFKGYEEKSEGHNIFVYFATVYLNTGISYFFLIFNCIIFDLFYRFVNVF